MNFHEMELEWIRNLHAFLRGPWVDSFFRYWDFVDSGWFIILFVGAITYLFSRKEGIPLLFIFLIAAIANSLLKHYFSLPRPCHIDPSVGLLCHRSFGFPSGAAQTATIIAGSAIAKCPKLIYKIIAVIFSLFFCFSRIFLGVHFFSDVLGGIAVGLLLLFIYLKLFPYIEKHYVILSLGLLCVYLLLGKEKGIPQATMMLGIALGLLLSRKTKLPDSRWMRASSFFTVCIGSAAFMYLGLIYPKFEWMMTFLMAFWFIYLGDALVKRIAFR